MPISHRVPRSSPSAGPNTLRGNISSLPIQRGPLGGPGGPGEGPQFGSQEKSLLPSPSDDLSGIHACMRELNSHQHTKVSRERICTEHTTVSAWHDAAHGEGASHRGQGVSDGCRCILSLDADCFYAQCETIRRPELKGKPVGVRQKV